MCTMYVINIVQRLSLVRYWCEGYPEIRTFPGVPNTSVEKGHTSLMKTHSFVLICIGYTYTRASSNGIHNAK